ncbi:MAG TPA: protein kinase [Candidatus Acidoferrum sp.]|nr:protein kinase [Candidatus Acidoferrum sp.]
MERLGKYEIISEIGRGAMGAVYKARDPFIERLVALKTITSGLGAQANSLERFYQEARSAGALQHPHIVTIYELGHENNTPFIAMEYIEGGSLDHFIELRKPLPLSVKLGYIVHVCEALSFAHRHNVVHRDIKPGNIMVTKEGVVKVVDFGIARLTDMSLTQPNMMIGSRAYMSPQLYKGERADARADIWAVGVTLYELIAYERPFNGDSEAELMFHILTDPPPPLQLADVDCAAELSSIISRTLEKKADDRYQSMEDLLRDLEPLWKNAQQATVAGLLSDSQQLVAVNDLQRAQELLRKAWQIDLGNTRVKSLLEKVTSELRRTQVLPKVNEHLERGLSFLQTGKLREARAEVQAALGLDSRHESAQHLFNEVEAATARAQEVEQKLRLTKQRLAEGALTEAATALGHALELDSANAQAKELRRQIDEERNRRERRKKLGEILHQARTLWTALDYDGCLKVISEALKEFPEDPELLKLQEMARHDLEDLSKQRQLGEVRKLLGQLEFAPARKIIEALAKQYPQDSAVKNLQTLVLDTEREQRKSKRFVDELADLRTLLSSGKFGDAVARGSALLREYPEEFELRELLDYARGEQTQEEQRQKEKACEREIRELIEAEKYRDAEAAARRAAQEFPKLELFRALAEEAGQKRRAQEQGSRTRQDMMKRIREIDKQIQKEKISDAIELAQQTLVQMGPDPQVTQLLNVATVKKEQQQQFAAAQTMVESGNFAGATQVLNQALAAQIFEQSDPRVQQRLREIDQLSIEASDKTPSWTGEKDKNSDASGPAPSFSATLVTGAAASPARRGSDATPRAGSEKRTGQEKIPPRPKGADAIKASSGKPATASKDAVKESSQSFAAKVPFLLQSAAKAVRKPAVFVSVGVLALILIGAKLIPHHSSPNTGKEKELRDRAAQLWAAHQLDESEQAWRDVASLHGSYQGEASDQIKDIETKKQQENQRFQEGETLLEQKDYAGAALAFQEITQENLWLADKARAELEKAKALGGAAVSRVEEQAHFDQGKKYFESRAYEPARKEFQAIRDMNLADSTLRPDSEKYLRRIKLATDDKGLLDAALQDIKNENWAEAHNKLQQVVQHKTPLSNDATQKLGEVAEAQKAQEEFAKSLQSEAYGRARSQVDAMPWPKMQASSRQKLEAAQRRQLDEYQSRATALQGSNDIKEIERLQDDVRKFAGRAEEAAVVQSANQLDRQLGEAARTGREKQGDKEAFDAAVAGFFAAKQRRDVNLLSHDVMQRFQKIARGSGMYSDPANTYVGKTIPAAIAELTKGNLKLFLPALKCEGAGAPSTPPQPSLVAVTCAQLDANAPLQWSDTYSVDFPDSANQPRKLPYTLRLIVTVDPSGKVKVDKDGDVDKDFLKKAKDASKNWKTTIPKSGGKPVSVKFPLSITFQR